MEREHTITACRSKTLSATMTMTTNNQNFNRTKMTIETFTIGNSILYCGDCRKIIDRLAFDAVVTDPPYGLAKVLNRNWDNFSKILNKQQRAKAKERNLHSGGTWATKDIYKDIDWDNETPDVTFLLQRDVPTMIFGGNYFSLPPSRKWIIWFKGATHFRRSFDGNIRLFEWIPETNRGFHSNGSRTEKVHPTQKPVKVMEFCISELPKNTGNVICDPYMGSGTTGVAAINLGRAFIGIEQKRKYFDIACQRIEKAYAEHQNQFPEVREMIEQKQLFTE